MSISIKAQKYGVVKLLTKDSYNLNANVVIHFRLFRCAGCGRGAIGCVRMKLKHAEYPHDIDKLVWFERESKERLPLPEETPHGIKSEFREGERCMEINANRAAAGMFRSVLDKTMRANGYKIKRGTPLESQIDAAAEDGAITAARKRRAHDEVRVLGNDVLHDEWHEIPEEDVRAARHYTQRILEDFYDDRESVLNLLRDAGRVPDEEKPAEEET